MKSAGPQNLNLNMSKAIFVFLVDFSDMLLYLVSII